MKRTTHGKVAAQPEHQGGRRPDPQASSQADRVRASLVLCPGKARARKTS